MRTTLVTARLTKEHSGKEKYVFSFPFLVSMPFMKAFFTLTTFVAVYHRNYTGFHIKVPKRLPENP